MTESNKKVMADKMCSTAENERRILASHIHQLY